ncbi:tripartite tricarboxylate transporter substrate binding protein [Acidovorax sp. NCPPB 2350]|nr:tripartite tricarboxylate transporter substrate binding protein [Acidovorax sp. NCPPB 2350]
MDRKTFLRYGAAAAGAALSPVLRAAPAYPDRPVKLVVPFSAGGTTDVVARLVAQRWEKHLGQPIVIDNKPGAGGNIGADSVAKAPGDGYTLLYGTVSNFALNIGLYKKLPLSPLTDLAPIGMVVQVPIVLVISPSMGVKDFAGFIQLLKNNPGKYSYGSAGNGSSAHIACHLLLRQTGTQAEHIPYKGNQQAVNDIMAGSIAFGVSSVPAAAELIAAGKLVPIAAIATKRLTAFPQLPTTAELGLKNYDAYAWNAVAAPAKTPPTILDQLNSSLNKALQEPDLSGRLELQGVVPLPGYSRKATGDYFKAEADKWIPIVRSSGAQVD